VLQATKASSSIRFPRAPNIFVPSVEKNGRNADPSFGNNTSHHPL
jgi:hypothetical protein